MNQIVLGWSNEKRRYGWGTCTLEGKHKKRKIVIGKSARIVSSWKFNIEIYPGEGDNEDLDLIFLS